MIPGLKVVIEHDNEFFYSWSLGNVPASQQERMERNKQEISCSKNAKIVSFQTLFNSLDTTKKKKVTEIKKG